MNRAQRRAMAKGKRSGFDKAEWTRGMLADDRLSLGDKMFALAMAARADKDGYFTLPEWAEE